MRVCVRLVFSGFFFIIICTSDLLFLSIFKTPWLEYGIKPEVAIQSRLHEEKSNLGDFLHPQLLLRVLFPLRTAAFCTIVPLQDIDRRCRD